MELKPDYILCYQFYFGYKSCDTHPRYSAPTWPLGGVPFNQDGRTTTWDIFSKKQRPSPRSLIRTDLSEEIKLFRKAPKCFIKRVIKQTNKMLEHVLPLPRLKALPHLSCSQPLSGIISLHRLPQASSPLQCPSWWLLPPKLELNTPSLAPSLFPSLLFLPCHGHLDTLIRLYVFVSLFNNWVLKGQYGNVHFYIPTVQHSTCHTEVHLMFAEWVANCMRS